MNKAKFNSKDVNWEELDAIGISRETLDKTGQTQRFLNGEKTNPISLQITLLGCELEIEACLQLMENNESPIVSIISLSAEESGFE